MFLRNLTYYYNNHKEVLTIFTFQSFLSFFTSVLYALMPVIIGSVYGEFYAGLVIGISNLIAGFIVTPIVGNIADYYGSKIILIYNKLLLILCSILFFFIDYNDYIILIMFFLFLISYSFNLADVYALRTIKEDEGGLVFGIEQNIYAFATFLATLAIPFFLITSNQKFIAYFIFIFSIINLIVLFFIKNDIDKNTNLNKKFSIKNLNPINSFKRGLEFIRENSGYPILVIGKMFFGGVFYGTIWFVIPLYLADLVTSSVEGGLQLGIYELITILIAAYTGYLADKYDWKKLYLAGWILVIIGVCLMPFFYWPTSLILIGLIIAIGDNFSYAASEHALEKYDIDHEEDGSFIAFRDMFEDLGYGISPIVSGYLYFNYGFQASLLFMAIVCALLGFYMIYVVLRKLK